MKRELWREPRSRTRPSRGEAASCGPPCSGVPVAADTRPGAAAPGYLVCTQPCLLDPVVVRTSLSMGRPSASEKSLDSHLLPVLCSVRFRPEHGEQDASPPLPDLQSPPGSARRPCVCQRFRPRTQKARPFQQPPPHSCSSRLFLTVPRHHSASLTPSVLRIVRVSFLVFRTPSPAWSCY